MVIRHERFVETNPDAILIEDATTIQKKSYSLYLGFGYVLHGTEQQAVGKLEEDLKFNGLLEEAWSKAEIELKKFSFSPTDKLATLSKECKTAIVAYTLETPNLYRYFNLDSRGVSYNFGWESFSYKGLWLLLQKALLSPAASYKESFFVYRGCSVQFTVDIGSKIMFQQFVSTTTNKKIAEEFAASSSGTMFIIEVSVALGVHKLSVYPEEEEYLLAPNHGYRVVDMKQKGKVREIHLKTLDFSFIV